MEEEEVVPKPKLCWFWCKGDAVPPGVGGATDRCGPASSPQLEGLVTCCLSLSSCSLCLSLSPLVLLKGQLVSTDTDAMHGVSARLTKGCTGVHHLQENAPP